jgi:hypothetical protein
MKNKPVCIIAAVIILFFTTGNLFAEGDNHIIRAGVCKILYTGDGEDNLSGGISNSLYEMVSTLIERRINSEEISAILQVKKKAELDSKILALETLYKEKDLILFSGKSTDSITRELINKNELIESQKLKITKLQAELEVADADVDEDDFSILPIVTAVPDGGNLFALKPGNPSDTADANNLDIMVYGIIDDVDDYYLIELKIWNSITGRDFGSWKTAVRYNDLQKEIQPGIDEIKTRILGREWAGLIVQSSENSMIYIDGVFAGIGQIENNSFEPGAHIVTVKLAGFENAEKEIILKKRETAKVEIDTDISAVRSIVFQTFPQGADLYIDSVWAGKTPVRAEVKNFPAAVRLSIEGWEDKDFFIDRYSESIVNINLKPGIADRNEWVEDNRNRFYASLGAFVMSLPITAICYSGIEQTAIAYNAGTANVDELKRLVSINQGIYAAYLGSLGLNIILFFDTIIQAVNYVGSVDYVSK